MIIVSSGIISAQTMRNNLIELYKVDQADRKNPKLLVDFGKITERDKARRKEVRNILAKKKRFTAKEYYAMAMIFQHGTTITHYRLALRYANKSRVLGYEEAKWLTAAATDRLLMKQGKLQKYGTQFRKKNAKSKWRLYPVDPKTTDAERANFNVPSLHEALQNEKELNSKK